MAKKLSYADLVSAAERAAEDRTIEFETSKGEVVRLRPLESLPPDAIGKAQKWLDIVTDDKVTLERKIEAIDALLLMAADNKQAFKADLRNLPLDARTTLLETWANHTEAGE